MPDNEFEKLLSDVQVGRVSSCRTSGQAYTESAAIQTNNRSQEDFMESLERIINELKAHVSRNAGTRAEYILIVPCPDGRS